MPRQPSDDGKLANQPRKPDAPTNTTPSPPLVTVDTSARPDVALDGQPSDLASVEGPRPDRHTHTPSQHQVFSQPETPRLVVSQVADVIRAGRDGAVEVTLRPEELGRVSLSFHGDGAALSVSLTADRPETLDLLKRNIALLEQDLRQMGYASLDFTFGEGRSRENGPEHRDADTPP